MNKYSILFLLFLSVSLSYSQEVVMESDLEQEMPIFGDENSTNTNDVYNSNIDVNRGNGFFSFLKLIFYLLIIFIILFLIKNYIETFLFNKNLNEENHLITKLAHYRLDFRTSLQIVSILNETYIFLVTQNNTKIIEHIKDKDKLDFIDLEISKIKSKTSLSPSFKTFFKQLFIKNNTESDASLKEEIEIDIKENFKEKRERVKKL